MGNLEIEKKFLVKDPEAFLESLKKTPKPPVVYSNGKIRQGYLFYSKTKSVKVRIVTLEELDLKNKPYLEELSKKGFLTIKIREEGEGAYINHEIEKPLSYSEALFLYERCDLKIQKNRYRVDIESSTMIESLKNRKHKSYGLWEVDFFSGENEGLVMAEIELESPDVDFPRPSWLGKEVSGSEYTNLSLAMNPYKNW